ncbi:MAG: FtsW/RodA/SpoVE family cell cycle protein [Candidatus Cloacimonetes bacterium]|nr:FtsW/RodA/SpoVE family cell cycle protein [Candidatus Cloacimonadota bacterium]
MRPKKIISQIKKPDYVLAGLVLGLSVFGLMMVYDVSAVLAHETWGDKLWLFKNQSLWLFFGLSICYLASKIDYHYWKKLALPLLLASILGLILVLLPGFSSEVMGSRRRLALPLGIPILTHLNIQPSELAKFSLVLFLSLWLGEEKKKKNISFFLPFLLLLAITAGLVVLEPDLGTTIVIGASALLVYFLSGTGLAEVSLISLILAIGGIFLAFSSEYRFNRLLAFFRQSQDKLGIAYHINQILIALGSGGLFGLGLGQSRQKYQYLPEVATDSIFAIIGEELGFLGTSIIVVSFLVLIWRGLKIAEQAPDKFGKLLAGGITGIIGIQAMVNLCAMTGWIPLTGVPLPFISYGGSSLTILLLGMGILLNISGRVKE